jgi:hypothetical protein
MPGGNDIVVTVSGGSSPGVNVASDGDLIGVAVTSVGDRGPKGDTGPATTLTIGTVTGGATAAATLTGTAPNQTLSLVLPQGATGANVELQTTSTHIQWRLVGGTTWTNLVALSAITGPQGSTGATGANVELQTTLTHIQWRLVGGSTWTNLVALTAITGPQGSTGATGSVGPAGPAGTAATVSVGTVTTGAAGSSASVTNAGNSSAAVFNFTIPRGDSGTAGANGINGTNGREVQLQVNATHVQWRYVGDAAWTDLVALSAITGPQGPTGPATIAIGTVTTGAAGSSATVTNSGTSSNVVLDFSLPRGNTGAAGSGGASLGLVLALS